MSKPSKCFLMKTTLLFSLTTVATVANAEQKYDYKDHLAFGGFVGVDFYSDQNELGNSQFADQVPGAGVVLGLRGSYEFLTRPFYNLHGELELKLAISSTDAAGTRDSSTTPIVGWRTHARMDYLPEAFLTPFVVLGLGGETLLSGSSDMDTPDTDPLFYAGVGAKVNLKDELSVRADFRAGLMASREDSTTSLLEFFVGVEYRLGSVKPARTSSYANETASREPDTIDGVAVTDDVCSATSAKGASSKKAALNAEKTDSDGDGIFSDVDKCPDQPEDKDAFEDEDGCPDPDNDKDGILDTVDQCPQEPENINKVKDEDGCPDKDAPEELAGLYGVIEGVTFKRRKAVLVKSSEAELNKIYDVLKDHPNLKIEIAAHTTAKGPKRRRKKLSSDRAETIKWYLVAKGLNLDMLVAKGYGSDEPLNGKPTERVEIKKVATP